MARPLVIRKRALSRYKNVRNARRNVTLTNMEHKLQEAAVLVMPYFWDAYDYVPVYPEEPPYITPEEDDGEVLGGFREETETLRQARLREDYPHGEVTY